MRRDVIGFWFFFFNDTATTEIYTLSLHDALPICSRASTERCAAVNLPPVHRCASTRLALAGSVACFPDRKSTRLNSSHSQISYAVFCLKKKNQPTMLRNFLVIRDHRATNSSIVTR